MKAEFFCNYDDGVRSIGFVIVPESKAEADLLELTRKASNRKLFDYAIEFHPGEYIKQPTYEDFVGEL